MGHFSTLRTKWTDAEVLILALIHLNLAVKINFDVRGYQGQRVRCDIVCVFQGYYDLGYCRNSDGSFDMVMDLSGLREEHNHTHSQTINIINQTGSVLAVLKLNGDLKKYLSTCAFYIEEWYLKQELIDQLAREYRKDEILSYTKSVH